MNMSLMNCCLFETKNRHELSCWFFSRINNLFVHVQTILNDLKSMKVQIDAIVTKSETLKLDSNSEQYNQRLTDNGMHAIVFLLCPVFGADRFTKLAI